MCFVPSRGWGRFRRAALRPPACAPKIGRVTCGTLSCVEHPRGSSMMSSEALKAQIAREFGTPAVVIDLDRVEGQHRPRAGGCAMPKGVANRPHIKTHKSPTLAKMQVVAGARGITRQKLGEAEVMVDGGLDDILISYNLVGEEKDGPPGLTPAWASITVAADKPDGGSRACRCAAESADVRSGSSSSAIRGASAPASRRPGKAIALARLVKDKPRLALLRLPVLSDRAILARDAALLRGSAGRAPVRSGSRRAWCPTVRRLISFNVGLAKRALPSTGPAPTSSTTA